MFHHNTSTGLVYFTLICLHKGSNNFSPLYLLWRSMCFTVASTLPLILYIKKSQCQYWRLNFLYFHVSNNQIYSGGDAMRLWYLYSKLIIHKNKKRKNIFEQALQYPSTNSNKLSTLTFISSLNAYQAYHYFQLSLVLSTLSNKSISKKITYWLIFFI